MNLIFLYCAMKWSVITLALIIELFIMEMSYGQLFKDSHNEKRYLFTICLNNNSKSIIALWNH